MWKCKMPHEDFVCNKHGSFQSSTLSKIELCLMCSWRILSTVQKHLFQGMYFKGNRQFIFLCDPQKSSINVSLMKILKSTITKKVTACFYKLSEENCEKYQIFWYFQLPQWFSFKSTNSLKVTFWTNYAFPLMAVSVISFFIFVQWFVSVSDSSKLNSCN